MAADIGLPFAASLVKDFSRHPAGTPTPDGRDLDGRSWSRTRFDIVLAPAGG